MPPNLPWRPAKLCRDADPPRELAHEPAKPARTGQDTGDSLRRARPELSTRTYLPVLLAALLIRVLIFSWLTSASRTIRASSSSIRSCPISVTMPWAQRGLGSAQRLRAHPCCQPTHTEARASLARRRGASPFRPWRPRSGGSLEGFRAHEPQRHAGDQPDLAH